MSSGQSLTDTATAQLEAARQLFREEAESLSCRYKEACHFRSRVQPDLIHDALTDYGKSIGEYYRIRILKDNTELPSNLFVDWNQGVFGPFHKTESKDEALRIHKFLTTDQVRAVQGISRQWPVSVARHGVLNRLGTAQVEPDPWRRHPAPRASSHTMADLSITAALVIGAAAVGDRRMYNKYYPVFFAFQCGAFIVWQRGNELLVGTYPSFVRSEDAHTEDSQRLHSAEGPAFVWLGKEDYYWHGILVPSKVVLWPGLLTADDVRRERNAEVRRVMISQMGEDKYIESSGMMPIDHHPVYGTLYVDRSLPGRPIARLRVVNRTAEPDGTFKVYWLPINPDLYNGESGRWAQAASASMWRTTPGGRQLFFQDWREYDPQVET